MYSSRPETIRANRSRNGEEIVRSDKVACSQVSTFYPNKKSIPFASDRRVGENNMRAHERSHRILCESRNEHPQHGDRYNNAKVSTPISNLNLNVLSMNVPALILTYDMSASSGNHSHRKMTTTRREWARARAVAFTFSVSFYDPILESHRSREMVTSGTETTIH